MRPLLLTAAVGCAEIQISKGFHTLEVAHAVLLEAALSFLGLGVQPPTPSWGLMISEGKGMMFFKMWVIAIPGTALFLLVLCINLMGDGIRDVTAPENRN